ncbi:MAG: cupredoxin domain-containing protein [Chloroflexota bacterium]|nr:cupredoxin domain-containing protein [Chloroflexota bacterium]
MDFSFGPPVINVKVGTKITWTNNGPTDHTTTSSAGGWDSKVLKKGSSFTWTATKAGSFSYLCTLHPFMTGTVNVTQ